MEKSKWHNISIKTESFEDLQKIQKLFPIRQSIPQTIEWLIKVGQKSINKSELNYGDDRTVQSKQLCNHTL